MLYEVAINGEVAASGIHEWSDEDTQRRFSNWGVPAQQYTDSQKLLNGFFCAGNANSFDGVPIGYRDFHFDISNVFNFAIGFYPSGEETSYIQTETTPLSNGNFTIAGLPKNYKDILESQEDYWPEYDNFIPLKIDLKLKVNPNTAGNQIDLVSELWGHDVLIHGCLLHYSTAG